MENFAMKAVSLRRRRNTEGESEDMDAVNFTHSGAWWAGRTLVPFQAVSPLQSKIKRKLQKTKTSVGEAHSRLAPPHLQTGSA